MAKTADYGLGEFPYPRGWLMVAAADKVTRVPTEARFFGQDVVLYRGASGRPVMLDAYCPPHGRSPRGGTVRQEIDTNAPYEAPWIAAPA